ncbi:MAG TPA: hypothetical protein VN687_20160, partial [Blastocatellia bacterium]|nr:hypothetical protein [Blastocatellia bacterium]
ICITRKKFMFNREERQRKQVIKSLERDIADIEARWAPILRDADDEEAQSLSRMMQQETFDPERRVTFLYEKPVRYKADLMGIEIPREWEEEYSQPQTDRTYRRLSRLGSAKLHAAIGRKRREEWKLWIDLLVPLIGAIAALVGTLAALFAVLHKSN